jgi:hypothetical protein
MKVKLSIMERIVLGTILPSESDFTTLKIIRKLQEDLSFTEEEHKLLNFKRAGEKYIENGEEKVVAPGSIHWEDRMEDREFDIGEKAADIIKGVLKELDSKKRLTMRHMTLYEKFVIRGEEI